MKFIWSPEARKDLSEIFDYVRAENPTAAIELLERIDTEVTALRFHPALGRPGRIVGTRELVISGTPYIVAYRIGGRPGNVQIIAVRHGARRWPDSFDGNERDA